MPHEAATRDRIRIAPWEWLIRGVMVQELQFQRSAGVGSRINAGKAEYVWFRQSFVTSDARLCAQYRFPVQSSG